MGPTWVLSAPHGPYVGPYEPSYQGPVPRKINRLVIAMSNSDIHHRYDSYTNMTITCHIPLDINSLRPRPNRRHFADDIFNCIYENENEWIPPRISLKLVPKVRINNIPALVQIMAWRRPGDKPLSEPMMVSLLTHICVTRPQWVNSYIVLAFM